MKKYREKEKRKENNRKEKKKISKGRGGWFS